MTWLAVAIALLGSALAVAPAYLLLVALASFRRDAPAPAPREWPSLAIVIPAHNETTLIERCVASLKNQDYPADCRRLIVVADNCTDDTAGIAHRCGAEVLVREVPHLRGKGRALRWAFDVLLQDGRRPEAFVVVDADAVAEPGFLSTLAGRFAAGHPVVQADDLLICDPNSARSQLEGIAILLRNRIRFAGRKALGWPASLCGNGMLVAGTVLDRHPWSAFSGTEDGEYSLILLEAGVRTVFEPSARVCAIATNGRHGAYTQGVRWEGGRLYMMRKWLPRLLLAAMRRRDPGILSTALDLAVPPLALTACTLAFVMFAGALAVLGGAPVWAPLPAAAGLVAIPVYVLLGLVSARQPGAAYTALAAVPWFLMLKLRVYVRLLAGFDPNGWTRTERPGEAKRTVPSK